MRRSLFAVVLLAAACRPAKKPIVECDRVIAMSPVPGDIVWFGEMHGTEESPRFAGDVACTALHQGQRVQLGLEIWSTEQPAIDRFLDNGDRAALLGGKFWAQHDGRSSEAMVALLDRVRWMRRAGGSIEVVAFDVTDKPERDAGMAQTVLAARNANAVFVGLSGNIHSRKTAWNATTPLVSFLLGAKVPVKTYDVAAEGGTMWACMATDDHEPVCGEHPMRNDGKATPGGFGPARDDSHDGVYYVGPTKASFPAKP